MKIKANAKINLTLDILGLRSDGYHGLKSVMAPITLCDSLDIEESDSLIFDCNLPELCGEDNLCVRAARLFYKQIEKEPRVRIYLEKKIPFPAGLGGGSSDAAAVLKGLNKLNGSPLSESALLELAASLGSDIPFCLLGKPALCQGRGELLTELCGLPSLNIVVAIGSGRLSTVAVYREYDAARLKARSDSKAFVAALNRGDTAELIKAMGNAFEPVADILCPETKLIREKLAELGALNARLSGSGPSVFGVFESEEKAANAARQLQNMGYFAMECVIISE